MKELSFSYILWTSFHHFIISDIFQLSLNPLPSVPRFYICALKGELNFNSSYLLLTLVSMVNIVYIWHLCRTLIYSFLYFSLSHHSFIYISSLLLVLRGNHTSCFMYFFIEKKYSFSLLVRKITVRLSIYY